MSRLTTFGSLLAAALAAAGNLAVAAECHPLPPGGCPQVYRLHEQTVPGPAVNLLILPDGFKEGELDQFRCAAQKAVAGLLDIWLYRAYGCHLNIYRMDLAVPAGSGIESGCASSCPADPVAAYDTWKCDSIASGTEIFPPSTVRCALVDLESTVCDGGSTCELLGLSLDGESRALDLKNCVPDVDAVLVLANTGQYAGRGEAEQGLALSSLPFMGGEYQEWTWRLIGHELGHGLLELHDEYGGNRECPYRPYRNVVQGADVGAPGTVPWLASCPERICPAACTYAYTEGEDGEPPPPCPEDGSCGNGQPCCPGEPTLAAGFIGLKEGACGNDCGYYRATEYCMMDRLDMPFCIGCTSSTAHFMKARDMAICDDAPEPPAPGEPVIP